MSKVKYGLNVNVIGENNQILKGVVKTAYDEVNMALVEFEDGNIEKVPYKLIGIDALSTNDNQERVEPKEPEKIQDGAKVITKDRFIEVVNYVTSPKGMLGDKVGEVNPMSAMIKGMGVMIVGMRISDKLFEDKEEIEITKDQLKEVITENTMPTALVNSIDGKMSVSQVIPISLLSALLLLKVVMILFDESENE